MAKRSGWARAASTANSFEVRVPHHRVDHRTIDAGGVHRFQRFLLQIGCLAVMGGWCALGPEVDLRVGNHHGGWLSLDGGKRCLQRAPLASQLWIGGAFPPPAVIERSFGKASQRIRGFSDRLGSSPRAKGTIPECGSLRAPLSWRGFNCLSRVGLRLLGVSIHCHQFRHAIATARIRRDP